MASGTSINNRTVVHSSSDGQVAFGPDVCLKPTSNGPVPVPYSNSAKSADTGQGSTSVSCDGNPVMLKGSVFTTSTGDEAGRIGGVASGVTKGKAEFINYSFDVTIEGKNVCRLCDHMLGNKGGTFNTPPSPEMQPPSVVVAVDYEPDLSDSLLIRLENPAGEAIADAKYVLRRADGIEQEGRTDASGQIRVDSTLRGVGTIVFPEIPGASLSLPE